LSSGEEELDADLLKKWRRVINELI
jgi:hypothetical protein